VFGKHALRIKKNHLFLLLKIGLAKHALISGKGSAQPHSSLKTRQKKKSNEGFYWKSMNTTKNKMKNLEIWIFTQTGFREIKGTWICKIIN